MHTKFIPAFLFFFILFSPSGFTQVKDNDIVGKWATEEGKVIRIVKQDNSYEGTTLDGAPILKDLTYGEEAWTGTIQNRSGNRSADCSITIENNDRIKITARKGIFSKRFYWTRKN